MPSLMDRAMVRPMPYQHPWAKNRVTPTTVSSADNAFPSHGLPGRSPTSVGCATDSCVGDAQATLW